MLDDKAVIVLTYLEKYFKSNTKPITANEIFISGLTLSDISNAFEILYNNGYINLNKKYIHPSVESIIE